MKQETEKPLDEQRRIVAYLDGYKQWERSYDQEIQG
jgi:hypothetical protein